MTKQEAKGITMALKILAQPVPTMHHEGPRAYHLSGNLAGQGYYWESVADAQAAIVALLKTPHQPPAAS